MEATVIIAILGLVEKYGIPAAMNAIKALGKETITAEDVEKLKTLVKPPESY